MSEETTTKRSLWPFGRKPAEPAAKAVETAPENKAIQAPAAKKTSLSGRAKVGSFHVHGGLICITTIGAGGTVIETIDAQGADDVKFKIG